MPYKSTTQFPNHQQLLQQPPPEQQSSTMKLFAVVLLVSAALLVNTVRCQEENDGYGDDNGYQVDNGTAETTPNPLDRTRRLCQEAITFVNNVCNKWIGFLFPISCVVNRNYIARNNCTELVGNDSPTTVTPEVQNRLLKAFDTREFHELKQHHEASRKAHKDKKAKHHHEDKKAHHHEKRKHHEEEKKNHRD